MQFRWNHTQGAPDYDRETGFGFVTGAVYTADAALHIPETNSGFLPLWWYAGTPIFDIRQSEYGRQATAAEALRTEDAAGRRLPVWLRIQVPGEGVYRAEITVTGTNHAHSGLTTESFLSEGHWAIVKPRLRAGDICLFQFGHNDQKLAHLQARGGYTDRLRTYIKETRAAGAVPVLITPLARNSWRDPTHYNDFLADFADAVLDLGKEEAVPVLDLHAYAMQLIRQEGLETAKRWFYPGDYTHTNDFGAYRMAGFVAGALGKAVGLPVADSPAWTPAPPFAPLTPPKDCALPAPDTDPFADYDATRPQEVLTRAEALELAIKALKLFPINVYNDLYADIVGHETYAGTVQCAAQNDLIPAAWIADGRLYPQRTVTAADFLAVLMPGAAGRRPLAAPSPLPDSVPAYARFAAGQAVAEQLISADSLNDPITRSDAAALCRRLHI